MVFTPLKLSPNNIKKKNPNSRMVIRIFSLFICLLFRTFIELINLANSFVLQIFFNCYNVSRLILQYKHIFYILFRAAFLSLLQIN